MISRHRTFFKSHSRSGQSHFSSPPAISAMDHLLSLLQEISAPHDSSRRKPSLLLSHSPSAQPTEHEGVSSLFWFPSAPRSARGLRKSVRFDTSCKRCDSPRQVVGGGTMQKLRDEEIVRNSARVDKRIEAAKAQALKAQESTMPRHKAPAHLHAC